MSKTSLHRRDFLKQGTAGLAVTAILGIGCGTSTGDGESRSPVKRGNFIDAHVHIWTNDFLKYPLAPGFAPRDMKPAVFLPSDILRYARPSGVNRVVLVHMNYYGTDNSYMLDVIGQAPDIFRGIAVVNPEERDPDAKMRELSKQRVRGFRIYPPDRTSTSWLTGEGFAKMFRCGARNRLALCLLLNPSALGVVDRQCEKFPDTPVVIDHMARIGAEGPIRESDVKALCRLARHAQVKVKVSAFYALGKRTPPHLDLLPLIKRLLETFGPNRLMWASDCPFQVVSETYEDSISLVRDRLTFLSAEDKEWMIRRTADESFFQ